jgi:hypothetical protein
MAEKSVNWLVKCKLNYIRNMCITHWIYKNILKYDPLRWTRNSRRCDTVLHIQWQI